MTRMGRREYFQTVIIRDHSSGRRMWTTRAEIAAATKLLPTPAFRLLNDDD